MELKFATDVGSPWRSSVRTMRCAGRQSPLPDTVIRQIEAILLPLAFSGPCNVYYKLSSDGRVQIFEINPRLGGTLMLPAQAEHLRAAMACIIEHAT